MQDITDQHRALSVTQYRLLHCFLVLISNWFSECFRYAKRFRINYIINDWFTIRNQWEIEICRILVGNGKAERFLFLFLNTEKTTSIASCIDRFCLNISLESLYDASECQCCHNLQKYQPSDTLNRCPLKIVQSFLRTGDVIFKKNILHE